MALIKKNAAATTRTISMDPNTVTRAEAWADKEGYTLRSVAETAIEEFLNSKKAPALTPELAAEMAAKTRPGRKPASNGATK